MPYDRQPPPETPNLRRIRDRATLLTDEPPPGLAAQIAALRQEIAALRADLLPSLSPILTGPEVQRAYARMYARNHFPAAQKGTL